MYWAEKFALEIICAILTNEPSNAIQIPVYVRNLPIPIIVDFVRGLKLRINFIRASRKRTVSEKWNSLQSTKVSTCQGCFVCPQILGGILLHRVTQVKKGRLLSFMPNELESGSQKFFTEKLQTKFPKTKCIRFMPCSFPSQHLLHIFKAKFCRAAHRVAFFIWTLSSKQIKLDTNWIGLKMYDTSDDLSKQNFMSRAEFHLAFRKISLKLPQILHWRKPFFYDCLNRFSIWRIHWTATTLNGAASVTTTWQVLIQKRCPKLEKMHASPEESHASPAAELRRSTKESMRENSEWIAGMSLLVQQLAQDWKDETASVESHEDA